MVDSAMETKIESVLREDLVDSDLDPINEPRGGALRITALLYCEGFTPSGSRNPAPIGSRYQIYLDTPSFKPADHVRMPVLCLKERV